MKKWVAIISLFVVAGILGGCGPSAQEQYKEELKSQGKMNHQTFKVTLDDLSIKSEGTTDDAEEKFYYDVLAKQLKGISLEGALLRDEKSKDVSGEMSTNLLGQDFDFQFFSDNKTKDYYIKADVYNQTIAFIKQFTEELPVDEVDPDVIEGKYFLLTKEELDDSLDEAKDVTKLSSKQLSEFYDSLDKDSFKKEGDTITHRFTKKELEVFVESLSEKKDEELRSSIEKRLSELKKLTIDLTVDTKKHTKKAKIVATSKEVDGSINTVKLSVDQRAKNSEKAVKLPSKDKTISLTDFAQEAVSVSAVEASEEDIQKLLENVRQNREAIDAETAETYKKAYQQYLNDEQYKELSQLLDEIVAENSK